MITYDDLRRLCLDEGAAITFRDDPRQYFIVVADRCGRQNCPLQPEPCAGVVVLDPVGGDGIHGLIEDIHIGVNGELQVTS